MEQQQIEAMLQRLNIRYTVRYRTDDDVPGALWDIEVHGQHGKHVTSFVHCFTRWTFDKDGMLVYLSFGY